MTARRIIIDNNKKNKDLWNKYIDDYMIWSHVGKNGKNKGHKPKVSNMILAAVLDWWTFSLLKMIKVFESDTETRVRYIYSWECALTPNQTKETSLEVPKKRASNLPRAVHLPPIRVKCVESGSEKAISPTHNFPKL